MNFNYDDLQLIHFADPKLRVKPPEFDFITDGDKAEELAAIMYKKMLELQGAGLSANQVGLPYRMFVVGNENKCIAMFNPKIIGASKEQATLEERCVSQPDFSLVLQRPAEIAIEYQDDTGTIQHKGFDGVPARIILHEYDHMEGVNFTDHASNFKLQYSIQRWKKRQKKLLKRMSYGSKQ